MLEALRTDGKIEINAIGQCLSAPSILERPILLIAGGTGYNYTCSILQYLVDIKMPQRVICTGVYVTLISYMKAREVLNWASEFKDLTFVPVVQFPDDELDGSFWFGACEVVLSDFHSFDQFDIYIAGRFAVGASGMRYAIAVCEDHLFGDAFHLILIGECGFQC